MKKLLPIAACSFVCVFIAFFLSFKVLQTARIIIKSPLPDFLTIIKNSQASTLNLWLPQVLDNQGLSNGPAITGRSVLMYDIGTKKVLYSKNIKAKVPLASLTKIMTAIIALERLDPNAIYTVKKEHLVGEDSMGVSAGERLSLKELLYGLILHSGNDASEVIAGNYPGGRASFISAMNEKAKSLGLTDTNFTNPSGLPWEGDQYSTAYDLLILTNYALSNFSLFRDIAQTANYTLPKTDTHKEFIIENETNLLTTYPGVKGVKTGYTGEAGYCLITYLEQGEHKIIGILLNSENRRDEMKQLLDFALLEQGTTPPVHD